jgi:adenylate cyclase
LFNQKNGDYMKKLIQLNPFLLTVIIIIMGIAAYFSDISFLEDMELKTIDMRFRSRGPVPPSPEVVLAVIDEKSLSKEGKWIWPRTKFVSLINKLSDAGTRVVAFDIGFLEADDRKVMRAIDTIRSRAMEMPSPDKDFTRFLENMENEADLDQQLANAIKQSSAKIVLGHFFHMTDAGLKHVSEKEIETHLENTRNGTHKLVRYASAEAQRVPLFEAVMPQSNIPIISRATDYAGYFNMFPDRDGVVRWIPAVIKLDDILYAPLSLMTLSAYLDQPLNVKINDYGVEEIKLGDRAIPTDEAGQLLINYQGEQKTFPHLPITDILNDNIPQDLLKDKIVMVGATATGIYDLRVTPFGSVFPGLEIHANVVSSILSKRYLYKPAWAAIFDLMAIVLLSLFLWFVHSRTGVISSALACFASLFGYILTSYFLFVSQGWILSIVYPVSVAGLSYVTITAFKYIVESRQKKYLRDAFSTYLAPSVVKQLIDSPERLGLGGEERVITAFFSDVEGFTSISEKLTPAELVDLLNEFLTEMTDVILNHEGTVDKFEGDAIIAFFGAPNHLENQAETACMACIDMQKRLAKLRKKWQSEGKAELKMRIGLCTGQAVVGNMGSKNRMDYTMMGDTVNTAARLEGVNKIYGIYTLVSDSTQQAAGDSIITREIDMINVVGKKEPISVYELLGYPGATDSKTIEIADCYAKGLDAYRKQDWNRAIIFFNSALALDPEDGPSQVMLGRCNAYKVKPPPKTWNGSYTMTTK